MLVIALRGCLVLLAICGFVGVAQAGCTTSSGAMTFTPSSSYDVLGGAVQSVSGSAGLACTGSTLSLLGGSYARATITSANGFKLSAGGTDTIPFQVSADANGTVVFTQGSTVDYMSASLLSLLGIGGASNFTAPLYAKLTASPNVAAGTYTDTLTVQWNYSICNGIQIGPICVGYEAGTTTSVITVTLVVGRDCRISAPNVSFGSAPLVTQFSQVAQAALIDCTKGSTYKVSFSSGQNGSARPWRAMTDGAGHSLQYNIYRSDGVTIWDETNPLTGQGPGTGLTVPSQMQNYVARINAAQTPPLAGSYTDTVSVIVTF
ncbi:spore coat U domain-containing protein [soil metagenome]